MEKEQWKILLPDLPKKNFHMKTQRTDSKNGFRFWDLRVFAVTPKSGGHADSSIGGSRGILDQRKKIG
jgi:hypothetical protein